MPKKSVTFKLFESSIKSWQSLCEDAADFASQFDPDDVISISHSHEGARGLVVVWYWNSHY